MSDIPKPPPSTHQYTSAIQSTLKVVVALLPEPVDEATLPLTEGLTEGTQVLKLGVVKQVYLGDPGNPKYFGIWGTQKLLRDNLIRLKVEIIQEFQFLDCDATRPPSGIFAFPSYAHFRYSVDFDTAALRFPKVAP